MRWHVSVTLDGVLPSLEHLVVILLFCADASLILDLGEFGGPLLVHAVLQVATHRAVSLAHLSQHVRLVRLFIQGDLHGTFLVGTVLAVDL